MNADVPQGLAGEIQASPSAEAVPPVATPPAPDLTTPIDVDALQRMPIFPDPTCWSMVAHLYLNVLHIDPLVVATVTESLRRAARTFQLRLHKDAYGLRQIPAPQDWALVLMWPGTQQRRPHCGVFWNGKVLHATAEGVLSQDVFSLRDAYPTMEFWRP